MSSPRFPIEQSKMPVAQKSEQLAKVRVQESVEKAKAKAKVNLDMAMQKMTYYQGRALVLAKDPQFRTVTISTTGGAVVMGSVGGAFGCASGIVLGTVAGAVPALFTFGLSLPIGAVVGGSAGLCAGTAAGAGIGGIGGGVAGFGGYKYRIQIKNGLVTVQKKALVCKEQAKVATGRTLDKTKAKVVIVVDGVKQKSLAASKFAKVKTGELQKVMASDKFKVTAAAGTAGAVAVGGAGAVVGITAGAALGLIPALFTFGLSIPVFAVAGGCVGTASGTVVGATSGSALGYGGYTYKKEIRSGANTVMTKVKDHSAAAKTKVSASAAKVTESIKFYSGTGGTA